MATKKILRNDLLIEWMRKMLYGDDYSCYWCPIGNKCNGNLLCDEMNKHVFKEQVIDKFSTDVEVVE